MKKTIKQRMIDLAEAQGRTGIFTRKDIETFYAVVTGKAGTKLTLGLTESRYHTGFLLTGRAPRFEKIGYNQYVIVNF